MDPLTLWRYACLLSSVKSKGGGGRDFPRARRHMHLAADPAKIPLLHLSPCLGFINFFLLVLVEEQT